MFSLYLFYLLQYNCVNFSNNVTEMHSFVAMEKKIISQFNDLCTLPTQIFQADTGDVDKF